MNIEEYDLKECATNSELEDVITFIEKSFTNAPSSNEQYKNLVKLSGYLSKKEITIAELESEKILENSDKIKFMFKTLHLADILVRVYQFPNMVNLLEMYCLTNDVEITKDADEKLYCKKTNDIDLIKLYLSEVGQYRLLTAEEEKQLADENTEEARNKLVEHNLRLSASIAKRFIKYGVLPYGDLIQLANEGLIVAAAKFKSSKNCRFSTYGTWWIKQSIQRGIAETGRVIRIPFHLHENILKIKKVSSDYAMEHDGKYPTDEELVELTGLTLERIKYAKNNMDMVISLSTPLDRGDERSDDTIGDMIEDPKTSTDMEIHDLFVKDVVEKIMDTQYLNEKEKQVLCYRYGFYGKKYTLEEISKIYGVTRERIRQVEHKALRKARTIVKILNIGSLDGDNYSYSKTL